MQGAQGTGIEDMKIDARGAFAGLRGLQGSGGSTFDLKVEGGLYGVYAVSPAGEVKTPGAEYFVLYKRAAAPGN